MSRPHNKALHPTKRQGVPASRAVVEGRFAGEGRCSTPTRGTSLVSMLMAAAILALAPSLASACSCLDKPLAEHFAKARSVFIGELVSATPAGTCGDEALTFIASDVWKGEKKGPVVVRNHGFRRREDGSEQTDGKGGCSSPCPIWASLRQRYLVFAYGEERWIGYCTPFFKLSPSEEADARKTLNDLSAKAKVR